VQLKPQSFSPRLLTVILGFANGEHHYYGATTSAHCSTDDSVTLLAYMQYYIRILFQYILLYFRPDISRVGPTRGNPENQVADLSCLSITSAIF
jgi:hypothetical protein